MVKPPKELRSFESLVEVVKALRGPDGCPWDKEQTHRTLTPYAIEEAHELAEAIERGQSQEMVDELGDLLLQVALHSEIGRQEGRFDIHDVIEALNTKMVRRHPHVFSDTKVETSGEVLQNWAVIKASEKAAKGSAEPTRFDVPLNLPALSRASKIGSKTKKFKFDWSKPEEVLAKVDEELREVREAIKSGSAEEKESEIGDLLFSVAQLARHLDIEPEQALRVTNQRFENRFFKMKDLAKKDARVFEELTPAELEEYWRRVKLES
jgi:tetrapyrrole methylase family protein / MazG family protein